MNQFEIDQYTFRRLDQEIDLMKQAIDSYTRNSHLGQDSVSLIADCERRIFNAAINLGNLDLAYEYAKNADDKKLITRLGVSLIRKEDEACKCVPDVMPGNIELPLMFKQRRMFNPVIGAWIDVYKCSKCNFMTAHPYAHATQNARQLERTRSKPENKNTKKPMKDHEAFKQ